MEVILISSQERTTYGKFPVGICSYLPFCSALSDRLARLVGLRGFSHRGGGEQAWIRQRMLSLPGNICLISCCCGVAQCCAIFLGHLGIEIYR